MHIQVGNVGADVDQLTVSAEVLGCQCCISLCGAVLFLCSYYTENLFLARRRRFAPMTLLSVSVDGDMQLES